jgi:multiple sugar transport system substrate-binding protein
VLCALALALATAGCTSSGESAPEPSPSLSTAEGSPTPAEPVTLRLSVYGDKVLRTAYHELADAYTEAHPSVTIELEAWRTEETALEQLAAAQDAGNGPDVFVASNTHVPDLVAAGHVQPLDQLLVEREVLFGDNFERLGLVAFSARDSLQCMPYDVSPLVVFYRPEMVRFASLNEPDEPPVSPETGWTWAQFAEAARRASGDAGPKGDTVKGAFVAPELRNLLALIRSAGDDLVDDPRAAGSLTFADPGTRAALEEVLSVVRDPQVMPSPEQLAEQDGVTRFKRGKVAMLVGTKALVPGLRASQGLDFEVMPLPRLAQPTTVAEVTGYCIASGTGQLAEAADFVTFATGRRGSEILARTGAVVPAHLPTLNSQSFSQPEAAPDNAEVFTDALAQSTTVPFVPGWAELVESMRPELERMFYEPVLDLETLLPRLDRESQRVLSPS